MKLFVTGGAGYIGSHFCQAASSQGHSVATYDNLSTGHKRFVRYGPFLEGDLRDTDNLIAALNSCAFDAVVHFAGKALVRESTEKPEVYYDNNTTGTLSLLQAMKCSKVKRILFSSSCATYGNHQHPIQESDQQTPINPYGRSKKQCEDILLDYNQIHNFNVGILRYFNVIGQDPNDQVYEDHTPETHIVPNILLSEINNKPLHLFGDRHPTSDGTCVRDYIDVRDLAQAHLVALEQMENHHLFLSNIGRGHGHSLLELIQKYESVFQTQVKTEFKPSHPGDPASLVASAQFFKSWYTKPLLSIEESLESLSLRRQKSIKQNKQKIVKRA